MHFLRRQRLLFDSNFTKFVRGGLLKTKSALLYVMTWYLTGDKPLPIRMVTTFYDGVWTHKATNLKLYLVSFFLIFEVKLIVEMSTVRGRQHSFSTHERVFLWKCQILGTENVSTWGGLELPAFGFMPNVSTYWVIRARHLLSHVFEHWLWRYRYLWSIVNI